MSNILTFKKPETKPKKPKGSRSKPSTSQGNTLCKQGHHKWDIVQGKQFEPREGKLVTLFECSRCKKQKTRFL